MSAMVDGRWPAEWQPSDDSSSGRFERAASSFREVASPEDFEPGRMHLFVAWTCPWAHRTLLVRSLKGLQDRVAVHFANELTERSWRFEQPADSPYGDQFLYELYLRHDPRYSGRITIPVLWDSVRERIVNNESSEIIRILDALPSEAPALAPPGWLDEIDAVSERMYEGLNNGVYRAGFAKTQDAYDEAVMGVFDTLDRIEAQLEGRDWLVGHRMTEADLRLFVTLFRFDAAYHTLFKCNLRAIATGYPNLQAHLLRVYQAPGVPQTCNLEAAKRGYASVRAINPTGIVPAGPEQIVFTPPGGA